MMDKAQIARNIYVNQCVREKGLLLSSADQLVLRGWTICFLFICLVGAHDTRLQLSRMKIRKNATVVRQPSY